MTLDTPFSMIALRVLGATGAAGIGAVLAIPAGKASHRVLCSLVSFAAGGLLAVSLTHLIPEAIDLAGGGPGTFAIVVGLALFAGISRFVYKLCPACSASETDRGFMRLGWMMMIAMGFHSLTDGLAIAAGFEASERVGTQLGFLLFLAVSYHKIPEGLALMTVVRSAGYRTAAAFGITMGIEAVTGLGALAGLFLTDLGPASLGVLLGVVAGSFLYIFFFAILKEMWVHEKGSIFLFAGLGMGSLLLLDRVLASFH